MILIAIFSFVKRSRAVTKKLYMKFISHHGCTVSHDVASRREMSQFLLYV